MVVRPRHPLQVAETLLQGAQIPQDLTRLDRLLRVTLWPLASLGLVYRGVLTPLHDVRAGTSWYDFTWWNAVREFAIHHSPYAGQIFNYPPSFLTLAVPFGALGHSAAEVAFLVVNLAAIIGGTLLALRALGVPLLSGWTAAAMLALAYADPTFVNLDYGDVNGLVYLSGCATLLLAVRRRWAWCGVVLGLGVAIKPALAPLVLLLILARQPLAVLLAVTTPVVIAIPAVLYNSRALEFFSTSVPLLLNGNSADLQKFNVALAALHTNMGVPFILVALLRVGVVAVAVVVAKRMLDSGRDRILVIVELSGLLLVTTFLAFSVSWPWYALFLFPLVLSVIRPGSLMRSPIAWVGVYCLCAPDQWGAASGGALLSKLVQLKPTYGYLLLFAALVYGMLRPASTTATATPAVA